MGNSIITCVRRLEFDAGHRLPRHEGRCASLHGHRYVVEIRCRAEALDSVGRVIDFSKIKQLVGGWIDENLDHAFIAHADEDAELASFLRTDGRRFYMVDFSPTAENLGEYILHQAEELLRPYQIEVTGLRLYETPNCYVDVER